MDLPLEPDLLEQRIGRLDRIGQGPVIYLHLPDLAGGPMEILFRWYHEGLGILAHPCSAGPAIHEHQLQALLEAFADPKQTEALISKARALAEQLNAELAAGRDRLLDLHSHRLARDTALVEAIRAVDSDPSLAEYLTEFGIPLGSNMDPDQTDRSCCGQATTCSRNSSSICLRMA